MKAADLMGHSGVFPSAPAMRKDLSACCCLRMI